MKKIYTSGSRDIGVVRTLDRSSSPCNSVGVLLLPSRPGGRRLKTNMSRETSSSVLHKEGGYVLSVPKEERRNQKVGTSLEKPIVTVKFQTGVSETKFNTPLSVPLLYGTGPDLPLDDS